VVLRLPRLGKEFALAVRMTTLALVAATPVIAAAGWSVLYLLLGGSFGGAILIFILLKLIGR
jgi:hypothetical protein